MSGFARKLERNKLKAEIKRSGQKRQFPLSKYRFKTQEELQQEYATRLTEQMIKQAKESPEFHTDNNE